MNYQKERDFQTKATNETFDEIYTKYDVSVSEGYFANQGYPFDYPIRWLNDPSMNKRIAIRRLSCIPSLHNINITLHADINNYEVFEKHLNIDITHADSLIKVLGYMCIEFSKENDEKEVCGLVYDYDRDTNQLDLFFRAYNGDSCKFYIKAYPENNTEELRELLRFLNQPVTDENIRILTESNLNKQFYEVWDRDVVQFHASFSTSKRKFIGINGDFYTIPTVLYPAPTNESTFYVRFTSNGYNNLLIRHSVFMIQLSYFVNYQKAKIL